jgi:hypothetical protein
MHKQAVPPSDPGGSDLSQATADEAEATFDEAEKDLQASMLTSVDEGERQETVAADDDGDPVPAPPVAQQQERRYTRNDKASRCDRACKALGSMQRSADRLCELTGGDDARCQSVRVRVEGAEELVRRFCPGCEN